MLRETARGFAADRGLDLAASLAFSTLLMSVPLVATLSKFLATFFQTNDRAILDAINVALPYRSARLTSNLREFIDSARAISGVGIALLLATSVRLIFVIENTVNFVWGAPKRTRHLARGALYTLGLFVLALFLQLLFSGLQELKARSAIGGLLTAAIFGRLIPLLEVAAALTILYRLVPNARVTWASAAAAGASVALILRLLRIGIAYYFSALTDLNVIYGSLSIVLIVLVTLYLFWVLVLAGVELTFVLDAGTGLTAVGSDLGDTEKAARLLVPLAGRAPVSSDDLAVAAGIAAAEAGQVLAKLQSAGLISVDGAGLVRLALPAREITLSRVVSAVVPHLLEVSRDGHDRIARLLRRQFRKLAAEREVLLTVTLEQLSGRR